MGLEEVDESQESDGNATVSEVDYDSQGNRKPKKLRIGRSVVAMNIDPDDSDDDDNPVKKMLM